MGSKCTKCHTPDGVAVAENGAKFVLMPPSYPGFLDTNLATIQDIMKIEYQNQGTELLLKPIGKMNHGGGQVLAEDSPEYAQLTELVKRLQSGEVCADPGSNVLDSVTSIDQVATLRKAAIDLGGRLPSDAENSQVASGKPADLDAVLDQIMTEQTFYDRLREIFNDNLLTDKYLAYNGAALDQLDENKDYPALKPFKDGKTPQGMDGPTKAMINRAVAREPVDLIAYVVRNNRPFTEIVTANYAVVNGYSQRAYGTQAEFADANNYEEFHEAQVTLGTGIAVPHAGVLSTPMFLNRWNTTPTNRNRARARRVFKFFLATDILKIAERPVDPSTVTQVDNPTMNSQYCTVCHRIIDPVAGTFRGWDDSNYEDFDPNPDPKDPNNLGYQTAHSKYTDMFPAGFGSVMMPPDNYKNAIQWLGGQVATDPRFVIGAINTVYKGLTGHDPLAFPGDPAAPDFAGRLAAWEAQDAFFSQVGDGFKKANYNLKYIFKAIIKSPYYRGEASKSDPSVLGGVGTGRFLTPEILSRKIRAVMGSPWRKQYNYDEQHDWLVGDYDNYQLLYGGIDSDNVTTRLENPNGIAANVAWRMANEMACANTAWDFTVPKEQRRFFPMVDLVEVPESAGHTVEGAVASIRNNIVHLHELVLGEKLTPNDPEVERTYQVFYGTWKELNDAGAKPDLVYSCQGLLDPNSTTKDGYKLGDAQALTKDPNYTVRAWMAVMTYLMLDYKFLYE